MTPVQAHLQQHGEAMTITVSPSAGSTDYDPAAVTDFVPGAGQGTAVIGAFSNGMEQGLDETSAGVVLVETLPEGTEENVSLITRGARTYTIGKIQERSFQGETDGFTLYLKG